MANYYLNDDGTTSVKKQSNGKNYVLQDDGSTIENVLVYNKPQKKKNKSSKKEDASVFKKIGKTIINIPTLMGEGAMKTVENVGDWANKASEVIDKPVKKALSKLILGYTDDDAEKFFQDDLDAIRNY